MLAAEIKKQKQVNTGEKNPSSQIQVDKIYISNHLDKKWENSGRDLDLYYPLRIILSSPTLLA